jgi:hypothetical protein
MAISWHEYWAAHSSVLFDTVRGGWAVLRCAERRVDLRGEGAMLSRVLAWGQRGLRAVQAWLLLRQRDQRNGVRGWVLQRAVWGQKRFVVSCAGPRLRAGAVHSVTSHA